MEWFSIEGGGFSHFIPPWSHSLLMAVVLVTVLCRLLLPMGPRGNRGDVCSGSVALGPRRCFPRGGYQLWPHSSTELGYGRFFGGLGGWLEAAVSAAGLLAYIDYTAAPMCSRGDGVWWQQSLQSASDSKFWLCPKRAAKYRCNQPFGTDAMPIEWGKGNR